MAREIYSETEMTALHIATSAHWGKKDATGENLIGHLNRVSLMGQNEEERVVGILHDIFVNTDVTVADLYGARLPREVVRALVCITRKNGETAERYFTRLTRSEIAKNVKTYELIDLTKSEKFGKLPKEEKDRVIAEYELLKELIA